jgi:hypothetical protein
MGWKWGSEVRDEEEFRSRNAERKPEHNGMKRS